MPFRFVFFYGFVLSNLTTFFFKMCPYMEDLANFLGPVGASWTCLYDFAESFRSAMPHRFFQVRVSVAVQVDIWSVQEMQELHQERSSMQLRYVSSLVFWLAPVVWNLKTVSKCFCLLHVLVLLLCTRKSVIKYEWNTNAISCALRPGPTDVSFKISVSNQTQTGILVKTEPELKWK